MVHGRNLKKKLLDGFLISRVEVEMTCQFFPSYICDHIFFLYKLLQSHSDLQSSAI